MSDLFNLGEIENSTKEKKEPQDHPKIKSLDKYIEQTLKCNTNEKNETLNKIKKKLTTLSDPSILEADILNESYYEISNNQIIRETIENLSHLFVEEDNIISRIIEFSYDNNNLYKTRDLFDALYYEFKIRFQNKKIALNQLKDKEEQNFEYIKNLENNLRKTQNELTGLKKFQETKQFRHGGKIKIKSEDEIRDLDIYDWIIDIESISSEWKIYFNSLFYETLYLNNEKNSNSLNKDNLIAEEKKYLENTNKNERIVSFIGLFDKGKSFVSNNLTNTNFPCEKKIQSRGLSFKESHSEADKKLIFLDTVGLYCPVNIIKENSVFEKVINEKIILGLVFEISDFLIFVMNEFTAIDQRYLDKVLKVLKSKKNKNFFQLIVVHNYKEVESQEILDHLWETQVPKIYGEGSFQRTKVSAINPINGKLQEKHVHWFKTNYSRHVRLCNDDSMLGNSLNSWTFSLIKLWLTADFSEGQIKRSYSISEILKLLSEKISDNYNDEIYLEIDDTSEKLVKNLKLKKQGKVSTENYLKNNLNKIQNYGKVYTTIKDNDFINFVYVPGYSTENFILSETENKFIIHKKEIENKEIKSKDFQKRFLVIDSPPADFDRKKNEFYVDKGILYLKFKRILREDEEHKDNLI